MGIYEAVAASLEAAGWAALPMTEGETLAIPVRGLNGRWLCYVHVLTETAQLACHSICPLAAAADKRPALAEFLTRANFGLVIGNFELDFDDGEVRFKTSVDLDGLDPSPPLVRSLVVANVAAMDRYLPGIVAVIGTDIAPAAAIAMTEATA